MIDRLQTSEAERQHMEAKYSCDALIAENKKIYEMKQAEFNQEVNKSKAEAELAYDLQAAKVCLVCGICGALLIVCLVSYLAVP